MSFFTTAVSTQLSSSYWLALPTPLPAFQAKLVLCSCSCYYFTRPAVYDLLSCHSGILSRAPFRSSAALHPLPGTFRVPPHLQRPTPPFKFFPLSSYMSLASSTNSFPLQLLLNTPFPRLPPKFNFALSLALISWQLSCSSFWQFSW